MITTFKIMETRTRGRSWLREGAIRKAGFTVDGANGVDDPFCSSGDFSVAGYAIGYTPLAATISDVDSTGAVYAARSLNDLLREVRL